MGKFKEVEVTNIKGLKVIKPTAFGDSRGYFVETYNQKELEEIGISQQFVQDNQSKSIKGVLRGLHFQKEFPQDKLVRVISGAVYDVAVDLRTNSSTFGKHYGVLLSAENMKQFFIPKGFAHGFLVLTDEAEFAYKCSDFYHPNDEGGIIYSDPELAIDWPFAEIGGKENIILSDKDKTWPTLHELNNF